MSKGPISYHCKEEEIKGGIGNDKGRKCVNLKIFIFYFFTLLRGSELSELRQGWEPFMLKFAGGGKHNSTYVALSRDP